MSSFTESVVEDAALAWLEGLGYAVLHGPDIAVGEPAAERTDPNFRDVILEGRLRQALRRLNPALPPEALEDAYRKLTRADAPSLPERNRAIHRLLVDGVTVEYRRKDGAIAGAQARVIDFDDPDNNDWLAVNQFTVSDGKHTRRPDVVLFVNGLPLAVIELKNPADENATVWSAFQQLQTYQAQIPSLFATNAALVVSDGVQARIGTLGAGQEWFKPWRTITGREDAPTKLTQLQVLLEGVFEKRRFLDLLRHFVVFEDLGGGKLVKKMAGYHQFHAVNAAVEETLRAATPLPDAVRELPGYYESGLRPGGDPGDRRVGVVWHTQGSGKSLTMAFYAGRMILHPGMANPTIVVLTDRNDLDDQLFGTFARCRDLLRQPPVQAADRADLRKKLSVSSGGVVFTTIQKFFPEEKGDRQQVLSPRRNIVVIADEAHRSQYDFIDGFARHMRDALPNASFIGFTGTPIEKTERIRDDVAFFQAVRAVLAKGTPGEQNEELDHAIRQIISRAVISGEVVDIFAAAGLKKPDISILSDEFLAEVRGMPQRNLAVELLQKLLKGEIKTRLRRNVVLAKSFADLLEQAVRRYQSRAIETAQVIEELIGLAKQMRDANQRGESLGLTEDELAFYDALETNDSAVKVLGEPTLKEIARELVATVKKNVTID